MSWFESIKSSSAARLVSSAAKEIFRDSTAEIGDPVDNLRKSQSRITELENLVTQFKSEIYNYQEEIAYLNSCVESLELRIAHNQEESSVHLREKEKKILELLAKIDSRTEESEGECLSPPHSLSGNVLRSGKDLSIGCLTCLESCTLQKSDESIESILKGELARKCAEIEVLRAELEQYGAKYHVVAALQEANAAPVARSQECLRRLGEMRPPRNTFPSCLLKPIPSTDAIIQTDSSLIERKRVVKSETSGTGSTTSNDSVGDDHEDEGNGEEDCEEMESKSARFVRISEALSSAVALLPPPSSEHTTAMVWPPPQPEAQVAVLIAAEAASRQELMMTRDYIAQLLQHPPTHSDEVLQLLKAVLTSYSKLLQGQCTLADFEAIAEPLVERDQSYAEIIDQLKMTPLEKFVNEICFQLESNGKILKDTEVAHNPAAVRLYEVLSQKEDNSLRNLLLTGHGRVSSEDQKIVDKFNFLVKEAEYKDALCDSLLRLLEYGTVESSKRKLDSDGTLIVERVAEALAVKTKNQIGENAIEDIRNRIKSVDMVNLSPELKSALDGLTFLLRFIDDDKGGCDHAIAYDLLNLLSLQKPPKVENSDHKLRVCLRELLKSNKPDITALGPEDHDIVIHLIDKLNCKSNSVNSASLIDLLKAITEEVQCNKVGDLQERIKSAQVDDEMAKCLGSLVMVYTNLWTKYAQAEKDKVALGQFVRSKHEESKAYHAQLQKLLVERQSTSVNQVEEVTKLQAKIERLELHLLQTEGNHTREAIVAEEREASLRESLAQAEAKMSALREFVDSAEERIECAREEREAAREAARTCQKKLATLRANYDNLQKALDSLEKEKQVETNATAQHFRLENKRLLQEVVELQRRISVFETEVSRLESVQANNHALQKQLERHADRLSEAHALARRYEERIQVLKGELKEMSDELNDKLDKSVMKSLLISCMKLPPAKRPEAFKALGSILNFTTEDYNTLGFNEPVASNWKELFWRPESSNDLESPRPEHSFIELLVNFLEKESAPPTQIRLPTEYLKSSSTIGAKMEPGSEFASHDQRQRLNPMSTGQHRLSLSSSLGTMQEYATVVPAPLPQRKLNPPMNPLLSGLSATKQPADTNQKS